MLRIHDILVWIRINGSRHLTNRTNVSGSESFYFHHWPSRCQKKLIKKKFFCILIFEGTFTSFFKGKKSKKSHKTVEIKVFLTFFASWFVDPVDPNPDLDPDLQHCLRYSIFSRHFSAIFKSCRGVEGCNCCPHTWKNQWALLKTLKNSWAIYFWLVST